MYVQVNNVISLRLWKKWLHSNFSSYCCLLWNDFCKTLIRDIHMFWVIRWIGTAASWVKKVGRWWKSCNFNFPTNSCKFPTDITSAENFNRAPYLSQNGGFDAPNFAFLEEKFPDRKKILREDKIQLGAWRHCIVGRNRKPSVGCRISQQCIQNTAAECQSIQTNKHRHATKISRTLGLRQKRKSTNQSLYCVISTSQTARLHYSTSGIFRNIGHIATKFGSPSDIQ